MARRIKDRDHETEPESVVKPSSRQESFGRHVDLIFDPKQPQHLSMWYPTSEFFLEEKTPGG